MSSNIKRFDVLGVNVSASNTELAIREIASWISQGRRSYVSLTSVHGVMESVRNEDIRLAHNAAGLVLPDGIPLVWLLRQGGFIDADQVFGPEFMRALFSQSQRTGYRHFLYGTTPRTLELLCGNLQRDFPLVDIAGSYAPPLRPAGADEDEAIIQTINASGADIVWVGLSTPKQELWMARHRHRLSAPVLIGVGAAFDIHAGLARKPPRWLQRSGLLMAYRAVVEPRRLGMRFLRNHPPFLALVIANKLGFRR